MHDVDTMTIWQKNIIPLQQQQHTATWHTMLNSTRSVTFGGLRRGNMSSAVMSMADAGFGDSGSVAGCADGAAIGLCLLLVVGIIIGVTPSSSSSRMELVCTQHGDKQNNKPFHASQLTGSPTPNSYLQHLFQYIPAAAKAVHWLCPLWQRGWGSIFYVAIVALHKWTLHLPIP